MEDGAHPPRPAAGGGAAAAPPPGGSLGAGRAEPCRAETRRSGPRRPVPACPRYVVGRQPEHHAAPGGAAEAGGRRREDQGLPGSCRAPAILHAKRLQRCLAGWGSCGEQSLP